MKQLIIFFLFLTVVIRAQNSEYMCLNWGLMKIGDTIMVDETEISIGEWLDYAYYHNFSDYPSYVNRQLITDKEKQSLLASSLDSSFLPDPIIPNNINFLFTKCKNCEVIKFSSLSCDIYLPIEADSLKYGDSKKRVLAYLNMPIVGLSFEQVTQFCKWRTALDSLRFFIAPDPMRLGQLNVQVKYGTAYIYRLPTIQEFDKLNPNHDSLNSKKATVSRFNYKGGRLSSKDQGIGITPMNVYSFQSSVKSAISGTKNMQGNVSEMTTTKGVAKGGSYSHYAKESYSGVNNFYDGPKEWLGFRCVGVLRQK